MFKRWQQLWFLTGLVTILGTLWLWGNPPEAAHACDFVEGNYLDCEFEFDFPYFVIEKINVYRYQQTTDGLELCYRTLWVYVYDGQKLRDNRATNAPVYPSYGSVGIFTDEIFWQLVDEGVIREAYVVLGSTAEQCVSWGEGHIQDEGPPTLPEGNIEPLDPIDPPLWKEVTLEEPLEMGTELFAYGYETEEGFYELFYVLRLE